MHACPRGGVEKMVEVPLSNVISEPSKPSQEDEGFTVILKSGRREKPSENRIVFGVGGSKSDLG